MERHIDINSFDYPLPDERIAKFPLENRSDSKLLIYRNGNAAKQQRGFQYKTAAESLLGAIRSMTDAQKGIESRSDSNKSGRYIINIPR